MSNKKSTEFIEFGGFSKVKGLKRRKEFFIFYLKITIHYSN
jgi:hypothetical protein